MNDKSEYLEHRTILDWVDEGSTVVELGCGSGDLLSLLVSEKGVKAQGIEVEDERVFECVSRGISVLHGEAEDELSEYGDKSFDYTVLSRSLQRVVRRPKIILNEALRVSNKVILSFSNFANLRARSQMFFKGRTPITASLPHEWHDTPNLHFLSILDFIDFCISEKIEVERSAFFTKNSRVHILPNLLAQTGLFLITRKDGD